MSRRGWLLFGAMSVIWGIPYLLIRVAVRDLSPATLVFARTAPAALMLLPVAVSRGALVPVLRRWRIVLAYTVVELGVPWFLLARAEQRLSSSLTSLLVATVPSVGLLVNRLGGRADLLDRRRLAGLALGLAGVAVLVGVDVHGTSFLAAGEMIVVVTGYAVGPILINRQLSDLPGVGVVAVSLAMTALAYAPWAVTHPPHRFPASVIGSVVGLTVVCTALAFVLFFQLIAEVGPSRATVITYVNPAVAVLLGVVVLGEPFGPGLAIGFPLVLLGSILATAPARSVSVETTPAP
ncbi:MAG TPA: DMT family transporter [Acidimicrobiales bacterium]|nr:DMT family transporter [Acidimicrobiales bacterium]